MGKPRRLSDPSVMRAAVDKALDDWRGAFRFNDQGLWNVLFYNNSAFYPLCLSGPMANTANTGVDRTVPSDFQPLLFDSLDALGKAIDSACGPSLARRKKMYEHPVKDCIPREEWERKVFAEKQRVGRFI